MLPILTVLLIFHWLYNLERNIASGAGCNKNANLVLLNISFDLPQCLCVVFNPHILIMLSSFADCNTHAGYLHIFVDGYCMCVAMVDWLHLHMIFLSVYCSSPKSMKYQSALSSHGQKCVLYLDMIIQIA